MPTLHVVMPAYNEGPTLRTIVGRVLEAPLPAGWDRRLLVVDDGSGEEGARVAREAVAERAAEGVRLLVHPRNRGKGAALTTGFDAVLAQARDEDAVLVQDADLEYDPADYPALLEALAPDGRTAVFGNRWADRAGRPTAVRRAHARANRMLTAASNLMTGLRVHDMECCYKVLPVPLLRAVRPALTEERFGIEPQLAAALARAGARLAEAPVRYQPRSFAQGKKIRARDGVRALWVIVRERLRPAGGSAR